MRFLLIGGIITGLILIYSFVSWYTETRTAIDEHLEIKRTSLEKQLSKLADKEGMQERVKTLGLDLKTLEQGLLSGSKPPVAAAEIQRLLRQMTSSLNIDINLKKSLNPIQSEQYTGIPVEIGFTTSTAKLKSLLYRIRTSPKLLAVSEIRVRVANMKDPDDIRATLVVTGFINKFRSEVKERGGK